MARIYFNSSFFGSNGSNGAGQSIYSCVKWLFLSVLLLVTLLVFLPWPKITRGLYASTTPAPQSELHYGIVIDCGSSGSRVYVYFWPSHSGNPKDLLNVQQLLDETGNPVVKKVSPGLSSFEKNPGAASDHIKELLLFAASYIPKDKHSETSLYVLATAGMRMLTEKAQDAILSDLRKDIRKDFAFIAPENHFEVITGKQEGLYAWIAINYVLDKFSHAPSQVGQETVDIVHNEGDLSVTHTRKKTVGIIDMGGGSVQIAFEVNQPDQVKNIPLPLLSEVNLGCKDSDLDHSYKVYVTTFLGYGANSARDRYEAMLIQQAKAKLPSAAAQPIQDVCLPSGMLRTVKDSSGMAHKFVGSGDFSACETALEPLMNLTVPCYKSPCSLNGIHQPRVDLNSEIFGFSEFWYSTEDVFKMGGPYNYGSFHSKAKEFCSTDWQTLEGRYKAGNYPKADDDRFRLQCFKGAWVAQVFHRGFAFPVDFTKLQTAQLIKGKDVGWTLGALIYKTRFLPLRDIDRVTQQKESPANEGSNWQRVLDTQLLMAVCVLVVLAAIVVYMKHLKWCPRKEDLKRVPSMSLFMKEQDQMEKGVDVVNGQSYTI